LEAGGGLLIKALRKANFSLRGEERMTEIDVPLRLV
jgi:hypothetical protein